MTATRKPMTTRKLLRRLDAMLTELAVAKLREVDAEPILVEAAENAGLENAGLEKEAEKACERAAENYDFDGHIDDAVRDFDFSEAIEKHADFEREAEKAVDAALEVVDIEGKVEAALDAKLDERLEAVLLKLLDRPEVAEKVVKVLFDVASR